MGALSIFGRRAAVAATFASTWFAAKALVVGSVSAIALPCSATTLRVPSEYPTIQLAVNAATDGDTVLISPGSYQEALSWGGKDLTVLGDGPAESIVIHTGSASRVMTLGPGITRSTVLCNLTMRHGDADAGGGLKLVAAAPRIVSCHFDHNRVAIQGSLSKGGAIYVDQTSHAFISDCLFDSNLADVFQGQIYPPGAGGAICVESRGAISVERSVFRENVAWGFEGGVGGAVAVLESAIATIDSCHFVGNRGYGGGVWSAADAGALSNVVIRGCTFELNEGYTGPGVMLWGDYTLDGNLFYDNQVGGSEGGTIWCLRDGVIRGNTIAFNRGSFGYAGLATSPFSTTTKNIICCNDGLGVTECPELGLFGCNNVWGNTVDGAPANYPLGCDLTGINDNISTDPMFCDAAARDLTIDAWSPCAPEHSPAGCGLIGALPVACVNPIDVSREAVPPVAGRLRVTPNPIRGSGTIEWVNENAAPVTFQLYDPLGRLVKSRSLGPVPEGRQELRWDGLVGDRRLPPGVYVLELGGPAGGADRSCVVLIR